MKATTYPYKINSEDEYKRAVQEIEQAIRIMTYIPEETDIQKYNEDVKKNGDARRKHAERLTALSEAIKEYLKDMIPTDKDLELSNSILASNENRFVSQTTGITCAKCGDTYKLNNRHLIPFRVERASKHLIQIFIPCPRCNEEYDLGYMRFVEQ